MFVIGGLNISPYTYTTSLYELNILQKYMRYSEKATIRKHRHTKGQYSGLHEMITQKAFVANRTNERKKKAHQRIGLQQKHRFGTTNSETAVYLYSTLSLAYEIFCDQERHMQSSPGPSSIKHR